MMHNFNFMGSRRAFISLLLLFWAITSKAQGADPVITEQLEMTPFTEFATLIKDKYGVEILYKKDWVDSLWLAGEIKAKLSEVLNNAFKDRDLHFFYENPGRLILTGNYEVMTALP